MGVAAFVVVGLIVLGVAVAFAFGLAVFTYFAMTGGNLGQVPAVAFRTLDSFTFLAIPFFLLAGAVMRNGGVSQRLVDFVAGFVGRVKGGMGATLVGACALFGSISGSSLATVSAIGKIMADSMALRGYPRSYVGGLAAVSGILGILIPPSVPMIVYGIAANVSISNMFLAGISSGLLLTAVLMLNNFIWARKRKDLKDGDLVTASVSPKIHDSRMQRLRVGRIGRLGAAAPALLMPIVILGGIYSGIFTPTEAGAVACLYGLLVGLFVYREIKFKEVGNTLLEGLLATAPILIIIAMGGAFARALVLSGIPRDIANWITGMGLSVFAVLLVLNIILLLVGMFIEENTAIIILVPLLLPLIQAYGIDPIQFGVIMVLNLGMGLATPPFAPNLFVAASACGALFHTIMGPALKLLATAVLPVLIVVNVFPAFTTWFL
ncbi:C4-dicarboxylate transporter DctM subunit [Microcella alkaliphila]|uniref:C4-dicarboxylate transporter DctM subunit n=1 Tax=Microcella alkaliphila TaxID=279828 RepID=A0A4Q7TZL5_9MICO|nr:TRAP transporter large permease [Microcella alkaliphila]RZT66413.1 C4-dicarboxylate transporter DctM subunit [Microcella alkaliphila]